MNLPPIPTLNPIEELERLALYVAGMAEGKDDEYLRRAAVLLSKASRNICAQGYFGCHGGRRCTSDHK